MDRILAQGPAWRSLTLYNTYRLILAFTGISLYTLDITDHFLKRYHPDQFFFAVIGYFIVAIIASGMILWRKPDWRYQVNLHIIVDLICLAFIMHFAGGVTSGLGMLMVVSLCYGSVLQNAQNAIIYASIASLLLIAEQIWAELTPWPPQPHYAQASLLSLVFIAITTIAYLLGKRLHLSQRLASEQQAIVSTLASLNTNIIEKMRTGLIAIDHLGQVQQINPSAKQLLGCAPTLPCSLASISDALHMQYKAHGIDSFFNPSPFKDNDDALELIPEFNVIGDANNKITLIFLHDSAEYTHQAQQLKNNSLKHLTLNIAHEIRNPLSAINHGAQLLLESNDLKAEDQHLAKIISEHALRAERIIQSVLNLAKDKKTSLQKINLKEFITQFIKQFIPKDIKSPKIAVKITEDNLTIDFDPDQLTQILTNLCENGLYFSQALQGDATLSILAYIDHEHQRTVLEVQDHGAGIDANILPRLFEPFCSSRPGGTGIGVYLAKELAHNNQAQLSAFNRDDGATFRLIFSAGNEHD